MSADRNQPTQAELNELKETLIEYQDCLNYAKEKKNNVPPAFYKVIQDESETILTQIKNLINDFQKNQNSRKISNIGSNFTKSRFNNLKKQAFQINQNFELNPLGLSESPKEEIKAVSAGEYLKEHNLDQKNLLEEKRIIFNSKSLPLPKIKSPHRSR